MTLKAAASATTADRAPARANGRTHLYEIDVLRAITALCVVGVHVIAATVILTNNPVGELAQYGVKTTLHFTREIFLSISAFVLVYVYANHPFSIKAFWKKRGIAVLLPYVVWSIIYQSPQNLPVAPLQWIGQTALDLFDGKASYQLYFILLTIEFYLILPWFLRFIKWAAPHPWWLLGISGALQIGLMAADYSFVQVPPFLTSPFGTLFNIHQDSFLPLYQFYLIAGGLAALYLPQLRAFLMRHGTWTIAAVALSLAALLGDLWYQTYVTHMGPDYGTQVFQPIMPFYALAVSLFLYWIAYRWATSRAPRPPRGYKFWSLLSSISFGIFLMHVYILNLAFPTFVSGMPAAWPEPLRVLIVYAYVAGCTCLFCAIFLYTPILSMLVGRPYALSREKGIGAWLGKSTEAVERKLRRLTSRSESLASLPQIDSRHLRTWSEAPLPPTTESRTDPYGVPENVIDTH
jgi:peptidoglycan/LPS O-acetylase OafA/YrhL